MTKNINPIILQTVLAYTYSMSYIKPLTLQHSSDSSRLTTLTIAFCHISVSTGLGGVVVRSRQLPICVFKNFKVSFINHCLFKYV